MDNKKLFLPIFYRIFMILWGLFCFYGLIYFVLIKREDKNIVLFVFGIMIIIFIPLTILMFVNYNFSKDEIIVKYPFIKEKKIFINDIIGYVLQENGENSNFKIYTDSESISVMVNGKKIKNALLEFMKEYNESIRNKNILELNTTGINITINNETQIHFHIDYLEIIKNGNKISYFYNELQAKYLLNNIIVLKTENDVKIKINIWKCRGRFGLFEYLINYKWYKK